MILNLFAAGLQMPSYVVAYGYALTDSVMKGLDERKVSRHTMRCIHVLLLEINQFYMFS